MKTNRLKLVALTAVLTLSQSLLAVDASPTVTENASVDIQSIRGALLPVVEKTLNRICGSDCPGFSIMPVFKNVPTSSGRSKLDDLGFDGTETSFEKQLTGVSIEVVAHNDLTDEQLASVRNTVAADAKNHSDLPVTVRTKTVASTAKLGGKNVVTAKDILDLARTGLWPIALLLLGLVGLGAIAAFFHQKRKTAVHAYELQNRDRETGPTVEELERREISADAEDVVEGRLEDLSRFLEECSYQQDFDSLRKVVSLFPGDALSKQVQLAPVVPIMISKAMAEGNSFTASKQTVEWLKGQLDIVHWKRLHEKAEPLAKLALLSPAQLSTVFARVPSVSGKAVILSFIESNDWPRLLSGLASSAKVAVGTQLFQIQQGAPKDLQAEKEVLETLAGVLSHSKGDKLVNDYVLYLSEEETRDLSQNLKSHASFVRPKSIEQVMSSLSERQLLELVLGLDIEQIAVLIGKVPMEVRERIVAALPKKLKERIDTRVEMQSGDEEVETDSKWLETRSRLMKLYNESFSRSLH